MSDTWQEELHPRSEAGKFAAKAEAAQNAAEESIAKESEALSKLYRAKSGPKIPNATPGVSEADRTKAIAKGKAISSLCGDKIKDQTIRDLLDEGRWDLEASERKTMYRSPGEIFEVTITPRATETVKETRSQWSDNPIYYDESLSEIGEDGYPKLRSDSGYSESIPEEAGEPGFIYRGVGHAEYQSIVESGKVQSRGAYNIGDRQVGLTYFADRGGTAASYAGGFQPYHKLPTFEEPSYIVKIARPPDELIDKTAAPEGEVGVRGAVPTTEIVAVYEVRPYMMKSGSVELMRGYSKGETVYGEGSRASPSVHVAYKKVYDSRESGATTKE